MHNAGCDGVSVTSMRTTSTKCFSATRSRPVSGDSSRARRLTSSRMRNCSSVGIAFFSGVGIGRTYYETGSSTAIVSMVASAFGLSMANRYTKGETTRVVARRYDPKSAKVKLELDRRARWMLKEWERSPTYTYADAIAALRDRYQIGHSMAEVAYARAREMFAQGTEKLDMSRLVAEYFKLYEAAFAAGKYAAACKILSSMGVATGVARPAKHEVQVSGTVNVNQIAHVAVLHLTPIQRAHRERELLAKAGLDAASEPGAIDEMIASVIDAISHEVVGEQDGVEIDTGTTAVDHDALR